MLEKFAKCSALPRLKLIRVIVTEFIPIMHQCTN